MLIIFRNNAKFFKYTASHDSNVNSIQLFNGGGYNCSQYLAWGNGNDQVNYCTGQPHPSNNCLLPNHAFYENIEHNLYVFSNVSSSSFSFISANLSISIDAAADTTLQVADRFKSHDQFQPIYCLLIVHSGCNRSASAKILQMVKYIIYFIEKNREFTFYLGHKSKYLSVWFIIWFNKSHSLDRNSNY